jgi:hypothetical protein
MPWARIFFPIVIGGAVLLAILLMLAAVPIMVQRVVDFHVGIGNGGRPLVRFLIEHRERTILVWRGVYVVGLLIALPAMIKDGFFTPDSADTGALPPAGPAGAQPPLEYQVDIVPIILLARTEMEGDKAFYWLKERWKAAVPWFPTGEILGFAAQIETHRLLGYAPQVGQEVVLFYTAEGWLASRPLEILPVVDRQLTYAPHDASVRRTLSVAELREVVKERGARSQ